MVSRQESHDGDDNDDRVHDSARVFVAPLPRCPSLPELGVLHRCYLINHGASPPREMRVANTSHFSME